MTMHNKHVAGTPLLDVCCICSNPVTLYTKGAAHLETEWGKFSLHFHKACLNEETKELVSERLKELALEHRP